jgi:integrase
VFGRLRSKRTPSSRLTGSERLLTHRSGFPLPKPISNTLEQAAAAAKERGWPPLHHKTATNYLNNLSALFNWAVEEGHVEKNPARALNVAAPSGSGKSRLPFSAEQLNRIFHAPLYIAGEDDIEERKGRFWVRVLSLWTGMRLNECVQLRTDDVAVLDGVDVILIRTDDEGDKRLKTESLPRRYRGENAQDEFPQFPSLLS